MVQWLGLRLPVQGTRIQSLVREDSTCLRSPRATTTEAHVPGACALQEKPLQREAHDLN